MESVDVRVLRDAKNWISAGYRVFLVTVVKTWGSSPRPVGSMMALREDGRSSGSVSGGCIEDDLIFRFTGERLVNTPCLGTELVRYGVLAADAHRFGLPCGGTIELILEFNPEFEQLELALKNLDIGQPIRRNLSCATGSVEIYQANVLEKLSFDGVTLSNMIGPQYRMFLIGAGVLAEYLSTMALFNDFSVTVCDPRVEYLDNWSVSQVHLTQEMPDDALKNFIPDYRTCVVALSHDPKIDDLALLEAINSSAFYVGAIGSRKNTESRRRRFIEYFEETNDSLNRLKAPVGIYIGSKTPAEIAVSIMAEILAVKNGVIIPVNLSVENVKNSIDFCST